MGKEWLHWIGGGGGGCRGSSGRKGRLPKKMKDAATSAGCMCAVFQLFDFHHLQLNQEEHTTYDGARTSLEFSEPAPAINASPISSAMKDEKRVEIFNFPVGKIQIKTSRGEISSSTPRASTCANSPAGTRTPGLVARLMGIDLLPECTSPSISSDPQRKPGLRSNPLRFFDDDLSINGARSLPETPRASTARKSEVEYQAHRLSLQINKENVVFSPAQSAGHFIEQVKDRVSRGRGRGFGVDLTNCANHGNRAQQNVRRDEDLIPVKPTKKRNDPKILSNLEGEVSRAGKKSVTNSGTKGRRVLLPAENQQQQQGRVIISLKDSKKTGDTEKCKSSRFKNKKNPSPPPTKLPLKQISEQKTHRSSPPEKQVSSKRSTNELSSKPTHLYKQPQANIFTDPQNAAQPDNGWATALPGGATAEHRNYIQKILKLADVINTPNTGSHSIDPSIFRTLELFHTNTSGGRNTVLSYRCNRKLIFQLVDELLTEISRPHFNSRAWASPIGNRDGHSPSVEELCEKIGNFPPGSCVVLEDVDSLIDRDLRESRLNVFLGEEEMVVSEIEGEILELLLSETAAMMGSGVAKTGCGCHVVKC